MSHAIGKSPQDNSLYYQNIKDDRVHRPISAINKRPEFPKSAKGNFSKIKNEFPSVLYNLGIDNTFVIPRSKGHIGLEKEKLYEEILHLKSINNTLKRELTLVKSENNKKEQEINKKDKVIEDIVVDSQQSMFNSQSESKHVLKAKDAHLLIKMKKQFKELKVEFKEKCEELEQLKKTLKLTKINEIAIESKTYLEELNKIKAFYVLSLQQNQIQENNLVDVANLQDQNAKQQFIINSMQENIQKLQNDLKNKDSEILALSENLNKKIGQLNKAKKDIKFQLEVNERLSKGKRENNEITMVKAEYAQKIADLTKDLNHYKDMAGRNERKARDLDAAIKKMNNPTSSQTSFANYKEEIKYFQENPEEKSDKTVLLLKSKLQELAKENEKLRNKNKAFEDKMKELDTQGFIMNDEDNKGN